MTVLFRQRILALVIITFSFISQSQSKLSGTVIYKASHDKTQIKKGEKSSDGNTAGIEGANQLLKNASDVRATLSFSEKESSYRVNEKLEVDGIESINITYFFAGGDNLYYHNRDSLNVLKSNTSLGKTFLIKNKLLNWKITKETKKIDDLLSIKAFATSPTEEKTKIVATAWFSPSIPIGYGPMEYFGLPGLIIELKFSKMTFIAEKINLQDKNVVIEKHKEAPIVTPQEFRVIAKKKTPEFFDN